MRAAARAVVVVLSVWCLASYQFKAARSQAQTGCLGAGFTECCTSSCYIPEEDCNCDRACYNSNDCCEDIAQTCPATPVSGGSDSPDGGAGSGITSSGIGTGSGVSGSGASSDHFEFVELGATPGVAIINVPANDDGASSPIFITIGFLFGRISQTVVYVITNGFFSFGRPITDFSPSLFPNEDNYLVAPFWADADISQGNGEILYEIHTGSGDPVLADVSDFISEQEDTEFLGQWLLVAEWREVPPFPGTSSATTNSFQGILITDGSQSYTVFTYRCGEMQWSGGATIGFNADGSFYQNHPLSGSNNANSIACVNFPATIWSNLIYQLNQPPVTVTPMATPLPVPDHIQFLELGSTAGVTTITVPADDDGTSNAISILGGFPFGEINQMVVYVVTNGFFSFGQPITEFSPSLFPNEYTYLVAPFWADADISFGNGEILYEIHNVSGDPVIAEVSDFISEQEDIDFLGQWLLVAEWKEVPPYPGTSNFTTNSFQGILITDGSRSYTIFTYRCGLMQWSGGATIGFYADGNFYQNHPLSGSNNANSIACVNFPATIWSNLIYQLNQPLVTPTLLPTPVPLPSPTTNPSSSPTAAPTGCVAAGSMQCCAIGPCFIPAGNCFCDQVCYTFNDCCEDVEETCPRPQGSGSGTPGSGSGTLGSGSGVPGSGSGASSFPVPSPSISSSPSPSPGCVAAGFMECCGPLSEKSCFVDGGNCFCDQVCYSFNDCCEDIAQTCPATPASGGSGGGSGSGSGSGISPGSGSGTSSVAGPSTPGFTTSTAATETSTSSPTTFTSPTQSSSIQIQVTSTAAIGTSSSTSTAALVPPSPIPSPSPFPSPAIVPSSSPSPSPLPVLPDLTLTGAPRAPLTEGDQLQLVCATSESSESLSIVWIINEAPLTRSTPRIQIETTTTEDEEFYTATSILTIPSTLPSEDSGTYVCRVDIDSPGVPSLSRSVDVIVRARNECIIDTDPLRTPCVNGWCVDGMDSYFCICDDEFQGINCTEPVVQPIRPQILQPPVSITRVVNQEVNLTCIAEGVPPPTYAWFRDGQQISGALFPYFYIPSVDPDERGYYHCTVTNSLGSDTSDQALLFLDGVRQYAASVRQPARAKRQDQSIADFTNLLIGRTVGDTGATIYNVTVDGSSAGPEFTLVITLVSETGDLPSMGLADALGTQLSIAAEMFGYEIISIARYDGCPAMAYTVYQSNTTNDTVNIMWPEVELGEVVVRTCPCGTLDIEGETTRMCGGSYTEGVVWLNPNTSQCEYTDNVAQLCSASELGVEVTAATVAAVTADAEMLEAIDITIAVEVVTIISDEAANSSGPVRGYWLDTIDQLMNADRDTVMESQEQSQTSSGLLRTIDDFTETVNLDGQPETVFPEDNYLLHAQDVSVNGYIGVTFTANVDFSDPRVFGGFSGNSTSRVDGTELQRDAAVSITLPESLLEDTSLTNVRFSYAVFANDILFQHRQGSQPANDFQGFAVGSLIVSAGVAVELERLSNPVMMSFRKTREAVENGTNTTCVFWDPTLDSGYGGFSTQGCWRVSRDEDDPVICACDHFTSFAILLDVSPREDAAESLALEVITYIGLAISIISLVITIITYLSSKKLRTAVSGQLLVSMCFALLGLYILFVLSAQAPRIPDGLCGLFSALLHYFLLAYFFWTAAEALFLYFKLVIVFVGTGFFLRNYFRITSAIAWFVPIIIVAISLGGYQYYVSDLFCRPYEWPFWFGFIVPFILIYIFNWVMFVLIMISLVRHAARNVKKDTSTRKTIAQQFFIAMVLSLLFGLGWAFGLIGTSSLPRGVYIPAQYIFSIFIGAQGVLIFILQAVRSADARQEWKRWWYTATFRADEYRVLRTTSLIGTLTRGGKYVSKTSTLPRPSDSFRLSASTSTNSFTENQPLVLEEKEKHNRIAGQETKIGLDTIIENPEAPAVEERESMLEGGKGAIGAINRASLAEEDVDANTTTKL